MAAKTYAQLAVATDTQDADLLATYRSTGPLKQVTALITKSYYQNYTGSTVGAYVNVPVATSAVGLATGASVSLATGTVNSTSILRLNDVNGVPTEQWVAGSAITFRYYDAPVHAFRNAAGSVPFGQIDAVGLRPGSDNTATLGSNALRFADFRSVLGTFSGLLSTAASVVGSSGLNIAPGVAPTAPVNGDVWTATTGMFARINGVTVGPLNGNLPVVHVRNVLTSGSANSEGALTAGAWNTRNLGTVVTNTLTGASLGANQITLPAGTYKLQVVSGSMISTGSGATVKSRIYNVTDSVELVVGSTFGSGSAPSALISAPLIGQFTIAGIKVIRLDTWLKAGGSIGDMGAAAAAGDVEVYMDVYIEKYA
jgi:hypothetical protein